MFRRAAVFPVCLASGEICLYPSTCRFPPFDAKLAGKQERHVSDVSFLFELVKKRHSPFLTKLGIAPTRAFLLECGKTQDGCYGGTAAEIGC